MPGLHPFPHGESVVSIRLRHFVKPVVGYAVSFETFWESAAPALMGDPVAQLGLVNAVHTNLGEKWAELAWEDTVWTSTMAYFYNGSTQYDLYNSAPSIVGTFGNVLTPSADQLPPQAALVIQRRTGLAGRNNRGRVFVPGLSEAVVENGFIKAIYRGTAKDMATAMSQVYTSGAFNMAARHWDRKNNVLKVVTECRALDAIRTRKDREPYRAATPIA